VSFDAPSPGSLRDPTSPRKRGEVDAAPTATNMTPILFLAQRASAVVLAFAVAIHLATIIYAVRGGLTAAEVLGRTRGSGWFLAFYALFVVAAAVHAPIGVRNVLREWTRFRGVAADLTAGAFALLLLLLGLRAVVAVYAA
jgi:succinate dehydrogenase subunit C